MKIRKLIFKSKLHEIEKQYQNVFIYHCSGLTNHEWRHLKDLLAKNGAEAFFQPSTGQKKKSFDSLKQFLNTNDSRANTSLVNKIESGVDLFNSKLSILSGPFCIFFFKSNSETEDSLSNNNWSEMLKKIESLKYNTKLILLYARIKSTIINHVDIKQALSLEARDLYQELLWCLENPVVSLDKLVDQAKRTIPSLLENKKNAMSLKTDKGT